MREVGMTAVERAVAEWSRGIWDPPQDDTSSAAKACRERITAYIHEGLGWTWEPPYKGDRSFAWCGAFVAHCYPGIPLSVRKESFASTFRLYKLGYLDKRWRVPLDQILAGDILVVGSQKAYGDHICLAIGPAAGTWVPTIEGNGHGLVRGHGARQGVVLNMRTTEGPYPIRFAYRSPT